jgi:hypothetical protein
MRTAVAIVIAVIITVVATAGTAEAADASDGVLFPIVSGGGGNGKTSCKPPLYILFFHVTPDMDNLLGRSAPLHGRVGTCGDNMYVANNTRWVQSRMSLLSIVALPATKHSLFLPSIRRVTGAWGTRTAAATATAMATASVVSTVRPAAF